MAGWSNSDENEGEKKDCRGGHLRCALCGLGIGANLQSEEPRMAGPWGCLESSLVTCCERDDALAPEALGCGNISNPMVMHGYAVGPAACSIVHESWLRFRRSYEELLAAEGLKDPW